MGNPLSVACWEGVTVGDSESEAGLAEWLSKLAVTSDQALSVCANYMPSAPQATGWGQERSSGVECQGPTLRLHNPERESLPHLVLGSALMGSINSHPHPTF